VYNVWPKLLLELYLEGCQCIITGYTFSFGAGWADLWLIKTDSQGKSKTMSSGNLWFEWLF